MTSTPDVPGGLSFVDPSGTASVATMPETERADAARNRRLLLNAAKNLIDKYGAAAVTMDAVAREAGVGKGTVFRRFGSRTGLMYALLDHSESELQRAYISGPAPLGPGAPALERLVAYGQARITMVAAHLGVLLEAEASGPERYSHPAAQASRIHVRILLRELGFDHILDVLTTAVLAPLDAPAVGHLLSEGLGTEEITEQWQNLVRTLGISQRSR